jgi:predicted nucleic acid-binding Zn ribbon protein
MALRGMRDVLRTSLGLSLQSLQAEDKLATAWSVVCGKAMAEHGQVIGFADGILYIAVKDEAWMRQMTVMQSQLKADMSRITGITVFEIHFQIKRHDAP